MTSSLNLTQTHKSDRYPTGRIFPIHLAHNNLRTFQDPKSDRPADSRHMRIMSPSHQRFTRAPPMPQTGKIFSTSSGKFFRWRLGDFALNFPLPSFEVGSMPIRFVDNVK